MHDDDIRLDIYDILDLMNDEVGYIGVDHNHKSRNTTKRDDIIGRTAFNNWKKSFNHKVEQNIIKGPQIDEKRSGKFITYLKSDIRRIIHEYHDNLTKQYMKKTIPIDEYSNKELRDPLSKFGPRIPKTWETGFNMGNYTYPNIEEQIENEINKAIKQIIDIDKLKIDIIKNQLNPTKQNKSQIQIKKYIHTDSITINNI